MAIKVAELEGYKGLEKLKTIIGEQGIRLRWKAQRINIARNYLNRKFVFG